MKTKMGVMSVWSILQLSLLTGCGVNPGGNGRAELPTFRRIIYGHDLSGNLYEIDLGSLNVDLIGSTGVILWDIAINTDGELYGISNQQALYRIDATTAEATLVGQTTGGTYNALVFDREDTLWTAGGNVISIIDPSDATTTVQGDLSGFNSAGDLIVDDNGSLLLSTSASMLIRIDRETIEVETLGGLPSSRILGLTKEEDGSISAIAASNDVYSIEGKKFESTFVGTLMAKFNIGETGGAAVFLKKVQE
jgi:hypothetical protein